MVSFTVYCIVYCSHIILFYRRRILEPPGGSPVSTPLNPPLIWVTYYAKTQQAYLHGRANKCARSEFWCQESSLNQNENVRASFLHGASERLGWMFFAAVLGLAALASRVTWLA